MAGGEAGTGDLGNLGAAVLKILQYLFQRRSLSIGDINRKRAIITLRYTDQAASWSQPGLRHATTHNTRHQAKQRGLLQRHPDMIKQVFGAIDGFQSIDQERLRRITRIAKSRSVRGEDFSGLCQLTEGGIQLDAGIDQQNQIMNTPRGLTTSRKKSLERFFSRLLAMIDRRIKIRGGTV